MSVSRIRVIQPVQQPSPQPPFQTFDEFDHWMTTPSTPSLPPIPDQVGQSQIRIPAQMAPVVPIPSSAPAPVVQPHHGKTVGEMNAEEFAQILLDTHIKTYDIIQQRNVENPADNGQPRNAVQNVLHTIGEVGHGVVDIAEGICRGVVDVITFGQSRR